MRHVIFILTSILLSTGQADAEGCPDFFRFVDFGLETTDGTRRGGPTYRAEGFDGRPLLIRALSVCRDVRDLAVDGRGNPIPVVASVSYDPKAMGIAVEELRLTVVQDIASEADLGASEHRARLEGDAVEIIRGPDYLCASLQAQNEISCQLTSPFGGNLPLVVYCDRVACILPVLAVNERVMARATWLPTQDAPKDHAALAPEIADRVQQVHDFLAPLSSWKADFRQFDR